MRDPAPENISGEKWDGISHTFDWGAIAQSAAVIVVILFLWWLLREQDDDADDADESRPLRSALGA